MKRKYETPSIVIEKFNLLDPDIVTNVMSGGYGEGGFGDGDPVIPHLLEY